VLSGGDGGVMSELVAGMAGAAIGYFANLSIERFRRRSVITDARRTVYAAWFTSESMMSERLKAVCDKLVGFPRDMERHRALTAEISSLAEEVKTLVTAMNAAFLLERRRRFRQQLALLNDSLVAILGNLDLAARHYGENLRFHETFENMTVEKLEMLDIETRNRWQETKNSFEKHDAECPFKSPDFRDRLASLLDNAHIAAARLRERLASALSK
jgi:hypothetical protein